MTTAQLAKMGINKKNNSHSHWSVLKFNVRLQKYQPLDGCMYH